MIKYLLKIFLKKIDDINKIYINNLYMKKFDYEKIEEKLNEKNNDCG